MSTTNPHAPRAPWNLLESLESRCLLSATSYTQQNLVSDGSANAAHTDVRLINPWGLAVGSRGIVVADNGTGFGTIYDASGNNVFSTVRVPGHAGETGAPTGVVINSDSSRFIIPNQSSVVSAQYVFVTENGTIDAWSGSKTDKAAKVAIDNSASNAVYKGVAIAQFRHRPFLFAANFMSERIEVYDSNFARSHVSGKFVDPNLPAHYSPFNIQAINNQVYVMYAKHSKGSKDETSGAATGVVDVFGADGNFIRRFTAGGKLNAPWGIAVAPKNFGTFSNDLLIGNFGDGLVNAFDATTGSFQGTLSNASNTPIKLEGLWGIAFGNGKAGNLTNGLYFGAGINDEANGLYGRLVADQPDPGSGGGLPGYP
jgi:uncharacterized protein (TIGR03118 family)